MNKELEKRIGIIKIQRSLLKALDSNTISVLFSKFFPVWIVHKPYNVIEFTGYSLEFEECEEFIYNEYIATFHTEKNKSVTITFEKVKQ